MTIMEALRQYFDTFPRLHGKRLSIDCLAAEQGSYSLDTVPCQTVQKTYLDGSTVCRKLFTLASRCYYADEVQQMSENLEFFEELEQWTEQQGFFGRLPKLGEGRKARSLRVESSPYIFVVDDNGTARYQIQFELIYLQEVNHETV